MKSFCRGPGGGFFKKSPLAAGGKEYGGGGIRTHGPVARSTVFETAPFDRSGTPPLTQLLEKILEQLRGNL